MVERVPEGMPPTREYVRRRGGYLSEHGLVLYRAKDALEVMASMREGTAERWLAHWEAGGSVSVLRMSDEEYRARQLERSDMLLGEGDRLRRCVRRARRQAKPMKEE
jgi:hypothetical protein